jgi:hypothetical protein
MKVQPMDFEGQPVTHIEKTVSVDVAQLAQSTILDYSKELPPPEVVLRVNGMIFGTLGNFSLIHGKAKSKKTFSIVMACAAALGTPIGPITGHLPAHKRRVMIFDTEQGDYHATRTAQRVMRLIGHEGLHHLFEIRALRSIESYKDKLAIIEHVIQNSPDVGLFVIDGIRDVVSSINDEAESTIITGKLLSLTARYQCHILAVLHQNKGNTHARGHLGTELINKSETVVSVEVDQDNKDVSKIEVEESRDKPFEPFAFMIGDDGLPEVLTDWSPKTTDRAANRKPLPGELEDYDHFQILGHLKKLVGEDEPNRSDLLTYIELAYNAATSDSIGQTAAKKYLNYYLAENKIVRHGKPRDPNGFFTIHPTASSISNQVG